MTGARPAPSLRQRVTSWAAIAGVSASLVVGAVALVANRLRVELALESTVIRDEQRIANAITGGVMRQLVTVTAAMESGEGVFRPAFDAAGSDVQEALRTYLFRPLTPEQRILIEEVKEEHRRMEVGALHAAQVLTLDGPVAAAGARAQVAGHAQALLNALDTFLLSRESQLERFEAGQSVAVQRLLMGGVLVLLLIVLSLTVVMRRVLALRVARPLNALAGAAAQLGAGDLTTRVPTDQDREFAQLALAFNQMAERLASAQRALGDRNEALQDALDRVRQAQDELVQSEKLGAVGRMTAGLAHELNNPLASVLGYSELLAAEARERQALPVDLVHAHLEPIVRDATRARLLIRSLLQFARRSGGEIGPVTLPAAVQVATDLRRHAFEHAGLVLLVEPVPDIIVIAEVQQLQSVFLNIINNAYDAMHASGTGTLRVRTEVHDETVEITFEDDGPGFAHPERIFEPFYTTKDVGQGTGLGLSLAKRFVESFDGGIRATNRPGGGARLVVRLRRTEQYDEVMAGDEETPDLPGPSLLTAGRTALVLEDEPHLQRLSEQLLQRIGLQVLMAKDAAEGRALLAGHDVDVIISDVKMPGESGVSFHQWVAEHHPRLTERFLFVTGDVGAPELAGLAALRPRSLLLKPFSVGDYLERVREVLEGY